MKMKWLSRLASAIFAAPETPVADLDSLTRVEGGCGMIFHHAVNRYSGYAAAIAGGSEQYDLDRNETGGWNLVFTKKYAPNQQPQKEVKGTFATLEEAVPKLRAASDGLKKKYSGFFAAAAGHSYLESEGATGLAAAELALTLKVKGSSPLPA